MAPTRGTEYGQSSMTQGGIEESPPTADLREIKAIGHVNMQ